jgi:hypothetical protein
VAPAARGTASQDSEPRTTTHEKVAAPPPACRDGSPPTASRIIAPAQTTNATTLTTEITEIGTGNLLDVQNVCNI